MIIKTESGSIYEIDDSNICRKYSSDGNLVDSFKVLFLKAVPKNITQLAEVWDYPHGDPEVGKLLYIGGVDGWWVSTPVVSVEYA
jgi:hypothetical protein